MGTKKEGCRSSRSAEMKFLRLVEGCTRLDIRNDDIRRELKTWSINDRIQVIGADLEQHLEKMCTERFPKPTFSFISLKENETLEGQGKM